jgi:Phage integrase family
MRAAGDGIHGARMRALIVLLWRAGLRINEALTLSEHGLDARLGAILIRHGKGGRRREVGMDPWGWEYLRPWLELRKRKRDRPISAFCSAFLAQLPQLMSQDAREQPRAGHDYQTQLLKKREGVQLEPVLRDPAVDEPVELEARKRDPPVGRRKPLEPARVSAFEVDPLCDEVAFAHRVLNPELKVRESLYEAGKKAGPCLGVQRGRLQTHGGIGDVILRTHVGLRRIVAVIEDLDPAA